MHDLSIQHYISSAVVLTRRLGMQDVADMIATIEGVEIHAAEAGKIVVVIEGCSSGALGERLAEISALDGVLAANMVFEHMETRGDDRP